MILPLLLISSFISQYVQAGNAYRASYASYTKSKNQYIQYHTASTRLDAISQTNQILKDRNLWLISYLKLLRQSLLDVGAQPSSDIDSTISNLNQVQFSQNNFLEINQSSKNWQEQLRTIDVLIASSLSQITATRISNFQSQLSGYIPSSPSAQIQSTVNLVSSKLEKSEILRQKSDLSGSLRLLQEAARLLLEISSTQ